MANSIDESARAGLDALERSRAHFAAAAWDDTHRCLAAADAAGPLSAEDLERLADAAHLLGDHSSFFKAMERTQRAYTRRSPVSVRQRLRHWAFLSRGKPGDAGHADNILGQVGKG